MQDSFCCFSYRFFQFLRVSQVLFEVVGRACHQHHLICLLQSFGVHLTHAHKLGECSENGFYGALSFGLHPLAMLTVHSFYRSVVIVSNGKTLLVAFAYALGAERTAFAVATFAQVAFLQIISCTVRCTALVFLNFSERDVLAVLA